MNTFISINDKVKIDLMDLIKSPNGNFYKVAGTYGEEIFKLIPLERVDIDKGFSIKRKSLIELGWKKKA